MLNLHGKIKKSGEGILSSRFGVKTFLQDEITSRPVSVTHTTKNYT